MHDLCQNSDIVLYCEHIEQIIEIILNSVATTEMTSHRVDSDLRTLFAIGKLDDYEKLKKECGETSVVLKGMEARIQERLRIFRNMSPREVSLFINRSHHVRVFLPFIFIVSGGGIALKSMQVNGANVITINFFVVSCLKGD